MSILPYGNMSALSTSRSVLSVFAGYNHTLRPGDGEWYDMRNLSGRHYPVFSPRAPRGALRQIEDLQGITGKDKLVYVAENRVYYGEQMLLDLVADRYELLVGKPEGWDEDPTRYFADTNGTRVTVGTAFQANRYYKNEWYGSERTIVSMGAQLVIFPDKRYVSTVTGTSGDLECEADNGIDFSGDIMKAWTFEPCDAEGNAYERWAYRLTASTPEDFAENYGDYYIWDGAEFIPNEGDSNWQPNYIYERYNAIGTEKPANPAEGDVWIDVSAPENPVIRKYSATMQMWVTVSTVYFKLTGQNLPGGFKAGDTVNISGGGMDGDYPVVKLTGDGMVLMGVLGAPFTTVESVCVRRLCPDMDFVIEGGNRLWGCRYGISGKTGEFVNEIYACKQGDPTNWYAYTGSSTDAYAVSVGSDGPFTGAAVYEGYPTFFKERYIHRIAGSYPASYQMYTTLCDGVQAGSGKSLAVVNGTLFYKSPTAIMAYTGGYPKSVSTVFGEERYYDAAAGALGGKYYVSMRSKRGGYRLYVYDTDRGFWHVEDETESYGFARVSDVLYCRVEDGIFSVEGEEDTPFIWYAQSGILGLDSPDQGYVSRINIRASVEAGASIAVYIQYDSDGKWQACGNLTGAQYESSVIPITPRRCDHYALRIEGRGQCRIYSIAHTAENGGDTRW